MSVMPGSQKRLSKSSSRTSISPRPLFLRESQYTPSTPVPLFSLYHHISLYVCSKSFCCRITGSISDNIFASSLSPSSRGSTLGAGKLSIASACLLAMQLNSHADVGRGSPGFRLKSNSLCRSLYHCSFSIIRCSSIALPCLYFCNICSASLTSSRPMA